MPFAAPRRSPWTLTALAWSIRTFELRDEHAAWTLAQMVGALTAEGFKSPMGARLQPVQVKRTLDRRAFYEGQYRYAGFEADVQHAALLRPATA